MIIDRGLCPGDTFSDGGRLFEVASVRDDGTYISRLAAANATEEAPLTGAPANATAPTGAPAKQTTAPTPPPPAAFECGECGKRCANAAGLATHKRAAHKSTGAN